MTNAEKCDELIDRAPNLATAARLIARKNKMSPIASEREYVPYGEFEKPIIEEMESVE